jgi:hypothetical protein
MTRRPERETFYCGICGKRSSRSTRPAPRDRRRFCKRDDRKFKALARATARSLAAEATS